MSSGPSEASTVDTFELSTALTRLGLGQYENRLRDNGFEDWDTVTAITEADLAALDFKRGDRRKLQQSIREYSISSSSRASRSFASSVKRPHTAAGQSEGTQQAARTTRPYRRHPRPDPNAPTRPKTAYVLFGENIRQEPALSGLTFTELAKETGKRWSALSPEERAYTWETPVADRLNKYKEELESYKQTDAYRKYQAYLDEFKRQQHNAEATRSSDKQFSSTHDPETFLQLPTLENYEDLEPDPQDGMDIDTVDLEGDSGETSSTFKDGMDEVRQTSRALGVDKHLTRVAAFPPEVTTSKAVQAFLYGTGSLLYLWSQDEVADLVKTVYHTKNSDWKPVHTTEVFAMAAVGSCCDAEAHSFLIQDRFLHIFLYMLSLSSEMSDLCRMRLFACLAICRFTNNVESARKLMSKWLICCVAR